jgi:hypothetical protein
VPPFAAQSSGVDIPVPLPSGSPPGTLEKSEGAVADYTKKMEPFPSVDLGADTLI